MTDARAWDRLEWLFEQAVSMPVTERGRFLDIECREDTELRRELESLLMASERAKDYLERRNNEVLGREAAQLLGHDERASVAPPSVGMTFGRYEILSAGRRRHGRGIPRPGPYARTRRGAQVSHAGIQPEPGGAPSLSHRGPRRIRA